MPDATDTLARDAVPTRDRIVYSSAELFRRQGYAGTGLKQIAQEADATLGSIYHFFPGGKEQLAEEVLRTGGRFFLALYESIAVGAPDLVSTVRDFFTGAGETLVATNFADACPIATVAGEIASTHEVLRVATADVFESWLDAVEADAAEAGIAPDRARALAVSVLALLEGAFLLSRSERSLEPMRSCGDAAVALVSAALGEVEAPGA
ncbi:MAG: TetR/AcrR family transcriptional regulator [Solirubrobacterales bacterium]|nr:TetR/AcrR family transcriptional regulator [Solirubrobacterales bacterium]